MFDMGAEYYCYGSDVTCSYPANGKFTDKQKLIYNIVFKSSRAVMAHVKPGVTWTDMHCLAMRVIVEELKAVGFLQGDIEELISHGVGYLFMPHGVGHCLGVDVHDVGGFPEGAVRSSTPGLDKLRCVRVLEENMVLTIEPGIYFNGSILEPALKNPEISRFLNRAMIEDFLDFGGLRFADDIVVTSDGMELMSGVPRTVEEIEALMAKGRSLPDQFPDPEEP
ncbi:predicted protein [Nematostella vectensis]|uniref:Peptidase M24 domain-containing protein n=2 Tax=Nematostella vectensis TaxID=45351 RepID=A7T3C5_NEMVE|nr:predicted protein [Nematostella vectensis]|eukprot:XP_001621637.1 hypothetical protein NEMVEDRAFT_v1g144209 [Nematostella vectensis]